MKRSAQRGWRVTVLALAAGACGDGTEPEQTPPKPAGLEISAGGRQSGVVDAELSEALVARVVDTAGGPVAGVAVTWTADAGVVTGQSAQSDGDGYAAATWHLGTVAGYQTATAQVSGLAPVSFSAFAVPGPITLLLPATPDWTLVPGWTRLLRAVGYDRFGNAVSEQTGSWISADPGVARVVTGPAVEAVAPGTTAVTRTSDDATLAVPIRVLGSGQFAAVATGYSHTCALDQTGRAWCWGDGSSGQLGTSVPVDDCGGGGPDCSASPVAVDISLGFWQIVAGGAHTCALRGLGVAYCWGSDRFGQLGVGGAGDTCGGERCSRTPRMIPGYLFLSLSAGDSHTCGVTTRFDAFCWGYGAQGRLGDGAGGDRLTPYPVQVFGPWATVEAGGAHTCGIGPGGRAHCWGYNHLGQLGDGTTTTRTLPTPVSASLVPHTVTAGIAQACAVAADGSVFCWGSNDGTLGVPVTGTCDIYPCTPSPLPLPSAPALRGLTRGSGFGCGLSGDAVMCWGANASGQLGNGSLDPSAVPLAISGGLAGAMVRAGWEHACAVTQSGGLYCWGMNYRGLLGNGTTDPSPVPVAVTLP